MNISPLVKNAVLDVFSALEEMQPELARFHDLTMQELRKPHGVRNLNEICDFIVGTMEKSTEFTEKGFQSIRASTPDLNTQLTLCSQFSGIQIALFNADVSALKEMGFDAKVIDRALVILMAKREHENAIIREFGDKALFNALYEDGLLEQVSLRIAAINKAA